MFNTSPYSIGKASARPFSADLDFENTLHKCLNTVLALTEAVHAQKKNRHRRTDDELKSDPSDTDKDPRDFQICTEIPLSSAVYCAQNAEGVYVLYLNGVPMKCGRASYSGGVSWRLRQYYNLNYDERARMGDCWSVSKENRDSITVSWQCCPASKCNELESKLFQKYGKGPWAKRAPLPCDTDTWELLI